jgi:amino acid transporter
VVSGHWVDEAFGFMAGWNFFFYEALLIPFEITALNTVLGYWVRNFQVIAIGAYLRLTYSLLAR